MRPLIHLGCLLLICTIWCQNACADFLIYYPGGKPGGGGGGGAPGRPGRGMMGGAVGAPGASGMGPGMGGGAAPRKGRGRIVLQGKVTPGKTVIYEHPTLKDKLYFSLEDVKIIKAKGSRGEFQSQLSKAGKDPDEMMKAAVFALKKGLLRDFYETVERILKSHPEHEAAKKVMDLKTKIDTPLPDNPETEKKIRAVVKRKNMRIEKSKHYILLHDTPEKPLEGHSQNRAQERLALLEKVYESFLQLFSAQDIELNIPEERLMVVLFNKEADYLEYATAISPSLRSALGFWSPANNVAIFYDQGTGEDYAELNELLKSMEADAEQAKKTAMKTGGGAATADLVRRTKTLKLLVAVDKENADIKTVSHECTHQMAGNTGLLPRHVDIPRWVHEGLATYFEAPGEATWAGIGAVNELRLEWYKGLEPDRTHSNIKFIATDQIFDFAKSHGAVVHGYGQAWALTHFLMENHVEKFVEYYRMLGEMPAATPLNPDLLNDLFVKVFGDNLKDLDGEWRTFMRSLQTDLERQAPEVAEEG